MPKIERRGNTITVPPKQRPNDIPKSKPQGGGTVTPPPPRPSTPKRK